MYRKFKHLIAITNRLIVCLKLSFLFRLRIFSAALQAPGGTPPLAVASLFSRSSEASYIVTKKIRAFFKLDSGHRERVLKKARVSGFGGFYE